jgi:uncharacterized membrane protein YecN with MAPEG domain
MASTPGLIVAAFYCGLLIIMNVVLQALVIRLRRSKLIGLGDGQDKQMARAIRAHGNFAENAPFGIGALTLLALTGSGTLVLHGLGLMLLIGRILHAWGISQTGGSSVGRVGGMVLTLTALGLAGLLLTAKILA